MNKDKKRPLPRFKHYARIGIVQTLKQIIKDLQMPVEEGFPESLTCPCRDCHECNSFFTHMIDSTCCPCTAIETDDVSCKDVILRLEEAIERLENS